MDSYAKRMQAIFREFERATGKEVCSLDEVAQWTFARGNLWDTPEKIKLRVFKEDMSRALREEYTTDPQGRRVRTKHAVVKEVHGKQTSFWGDLRTAPRAHMELSFQGRRKQIEGDCGQLKADVDSYNENYNEGAPIQVSFNFTKDLEERELARSTRKPAPIERAPLSEQPLTAAS